MTKINLGKEIMKETANRLKSIGLTALELALGLFLVSLIFVNQSSTEANASSVEPGHSVIASVLPVQGTPVFDCCVQDESTRISIQFNSMTGDYIFTDCNSGLTLMGIGMVRVKGCYKTLEHVATDRRVTASFNGCAQKGNAAAQTFPGGSVITILDRNTANSTCPCITQTPSITRGSQ